MAGDYSAATANFTCLHDMTHSLVLEAAVSEEPAEGGTSYTASVELNGVVLSDKVFVPRSVLYGDANSDGSINGKDLILLAQYLAHWDVKIDLEAADVNADGSVNGKDAIRLAQYLAHWDVTLG